ncbi:MAG: patatin-like phospholipase family protein [Alphaproteobacteria bacterium]|nr:patatin-like phospholipase family protein [Alphaproteobacteria bacterium]
MPRTKPQPSSKISDPRIGVALGSGSARGLSLIPYLEAINELGLEPAVIAGSSIGAWVGSGWAAGMSGQEIREHSIEVLGSVRAISSRLWAAKIRGFREMFKSGFPVQFDAERVLNSFQPAQLPETFGELKIPLYVVATDFQSWHQLVFHTGPLLKALAGSIAIPSLFTPVKYGDNLLVDGGVVNPLPLDVVSNWGADIIIALDVNGNPGELEPGRIPGAINIGFGSAQIMTSALINNSLAAYPPDVYTRTPVAEFGGFDYLRVREIFAASDARKDEFKRDVSKAIERFIASRQKSV